jgi:serine/threonine-protein kinase
VTPSSSDPGTSRTPAGFSDADLAKLEAALAQQIGPLARILVKKALKNATTLSGLASMLEENIPAEEGRRAFRDVARRLTP